MAQVVDDALRLSADRLSRARVSVARRVPVGLQVRGDRDLLVQACLNIINNAADAMRDRAPGALTIRARRAGRRLELSFTDTGPGVAPEVAQRIFDPFFTTKGVGEGTGLGLSITLNIVTDHGGTLSVENVPHAGACFRCSFPALRPMVPAGRPPRRRSHASSRSRTPT
ncbi:MAG: ATP-binding protein [Dehalococcoidia bacterium]